MSAQDIFGVIVRFSGLGCVGYGLCYVMSWLYGLVRHNGGQSLSNSDYFISAVLFVGVGLFLLRKADSVVGFAYPKTNAENKGEDVT